MKIERLYSDYQEEERLYSTGNNELDELLERAFCEGYEYAQREFTVSPERAKQFFKATGNRAAKKVAERKKAFHDALITPQFDASNKDDLREMLVRNRNLGSPTYDPTSIHWSINKKGAGLSLSKNPWTRQENARNFMSTRIKNKNNPKK